MKNFKFFALLFLSLSLASCGDDDKGEVAYGGASRLFFDNNGQPQDLFVFAESGSAETTIKYGVIKSVSGSATVSLVADTENSTAVEGVDYEIVNPTDELTDGETTGEFVVRFFEAPATQDGKVAVFKLQSSSLSSAVFYDSFTVNVSLSCTVDTFVGQFESNTYWNGPSVNEIVIDDSANTLRIEGFWTDNGTDLLFNYNPDTFVVTVPQQPTGFFYQGDANQEVYARPSVAAGLVSSFNPCSRVLTLHINYWVPGVGSFGDKVEVFTGI